MSYVLLGYTLNARTRGTNVWGVFDTKEKAAWVAEMLMEYMYGVSTTFEVYEYPNEQFICYCKV